MSRSQLIGLATAALQAQERLCLSLRSASASGSGGHEHDDVVVKARQVLDQMREIKGQIEGTSVWFPAVSLSEDTSLQRIKQLILMNVPASLTDQVKTTLTQLIHEAFQGSIECVLFAGLLTCPWYQATQDERGQQARHNTLLIVFTNKYNQFLAPVNPHDREKNSEIIDMGWLCAVEVHHFCHDVLGGKPRLVEALSLSKSAVIYQSSSWQQLLNMLQPQQVMNVRGFIEQARGQAVGHIAKKTKSGHIRLTDSCTLRDFCNSFRLLHAAGQALRGQDLCLDVELLQELSTADSDGFISDALDKLKQAYSLTTSVTKDDLFNVVMRWREVIDSVVKTRKKEDFTSTETMEETLSSWLLSVRLTGVTLSPAPVLSPGDKNCVRALLGEMGGKAVERIAVEDVVMVARAGSFLYGLNTEQSDTDYVVIYSEPTQRVVGSCGRLVDSFECRGPERSVEYGVYEVRVLTEMMWKCSIVMLELVFADDLEFASEAWKELQRNRQVLVTEKTILQYFGLIKNNMVMIQRGKHRGTAREAKLFYQIFHKLHCVEYLVRGEVPCVRCTGPERDFIMSIRRGPLQGDMSRECLYSQAEERLAGIRQTLADRTTRLPEHVDYHFLCAWLFKVRGWPCD